MNTFGLRSVNTDTFNIRWGSIYSYPRGTRNAIVALLRVHNLTLNILGYLQNPISSTVPFKPALFSGSARMVSGLGICVATLALGERNANQGIIIQHWYDEALVTGVAQVARGALEAFVTNGHKINLFIDIAATLLNVTKELSSYSTAFKQVDTRTGVPHKDVVYPFPFLLLHLV